MVVQVRCPPMHARLVQCELEARGAVVPDAAQDRDASVMQATAPLQAVLGLAQRLAEITAAQAHCTMQLSHYAPVPDQPPPGGQAA